MKEIASGSHSTSASTFEHGFVHMVFFWLKPDLGQSERERFLHALQTMVADSQFALTGHIGVPAQTPRDVVDNSYDYSLLVTFENAAAHDRYQAEPPHDVFRAVASELAERVQIYDSRDAIPA